MTMMFSPRALRLQWKEYKRFQALEQKARLITFYAEDVASMMYFEAIIKELTNVMGYKICYLTSAMDDPVLSSDNAKIEAFYIGDGMVRTMLFMNLETDVMVMTMPDLENLYIKRSRLYPVHYVYLFHSIVSTLVTDLKGAFDHYDTILCVGPHHMKEIRLTESFYKLKPKRLVEHGYGRLDKLLENKPADLFGEKNEHLAKKHILIAPSWGKRGLLEGSHGTKLVEVLLDAGYKVTVRPHPCTIRNAPKIMRALEKRFRDNPNFSLERDVRSQASFYNAQCMISDWSGVAMEYAFVLERPVIYIDVPKKIRNPHFKDVLSDPIDFSIRNEIGVTVSPDNFSNIPHTIERLYENADNFRERISKIKSQTVFNIGRSGVVGAKAIVEILQK